MESAQRRHQALVVEDDPAIRRLLKMVLERLQFAVETASDGVEAVLKLGLVRYDVIVLDLMMPNLDGFAFLETISESDPALLQRIIVTSAASPAIIAARLKSAPFLIVPKPFDIEQIGRAVRECAQQNGPD